MASEWLERFDPAARAYFQYHEERFDFLLEKVREAAGRLREGGTPLHILDIGLSFQTLMVQRAFPECILSTLGFEDDRFREGIRGGHYSYDLNNAADAETWPKLPPQDLAIMAEVIEHLSAPPEAVLRCVSSWLRPGGELVVQTPNAVSLAKRALVVRGHNPYMMPRENRDHSSHIREYTLAELAELGRAAGLVVVDRAVRNYFAHVSRRGTLYRRLGGLLPATLRDGITISYRKPAA